MAAFLPDISKYYSKYAYTNIRENTGRVHSLVLWSQRRVEKNTLLGIPRPVEIPP